eukprot:CAMPEP_0174730944 /NCGR_PEP_ID=MMETSP1094-20130205/56550_1 /TAXON_ID=156173 /ORGANISM="Chrysochromulina brevifilum, Strain UTEX LB 985" /LENGTH=161 /DNA_ID=CAMNT_0015933267 /DNA_START=50 /DNA_END=535 /DNA_ORIENTATION=+
MQRFCGGGSRACHFAEHVACAACLAALSSACWHCSWQLPLCSSTPPLHVSIAWAPVRRAHGFQGFKEAGALVCRRGADERHHILWHGKGQLQPACLFSRGGMPREPLDIAERSATLCGDASVQRAGAAGLHDASSLARCARPGCQAPLDVAGQSAARDTVG